MNRKFDCHAFSFPVPDVHPTDYPPFEKEAWVIQQNGWTTIVGVIPQGVRLPKINQVTERGNGYIPGSVFFRGNQLLVDFRDDTEVIKKQFDLSCRFDLTSFRDWRIKPACRKRLFAALQRPSSTVKSVTTSDVRLPEAFYIGMEFHGVLSDRGSPKS